MDVWAIGFGMVVFLGIGFVVFGLLSLGRSGTSERQRFLERIEQSVLDDERRKALGLPAR